MTPEELPTPPPVNPYRATALFRILAAVGAVAALGLAVVTWLDNSMLGFPDGYITEFERCMQPLKRFAPAVLGVIAAGLGLAAFRSRHLRLLVPAAMVLLALYLGASWWFETKVCIGLDHGQGG